MAFNSKRNNAKKLNTTTRVLQVYNDAVGDDSSTMSLGYWNDMVSININPILPSSERTDGKIYNYEKTASCLLNIDNIIQLKKGIELLERDIANEKKTGKRKVTSVAVKARNVVVKIGQTDEYDGMDYNSNYLALFSLTDEGEVDGNAFYIFGKPEDGLLLNFDEDEGSYKTKTINTSWEAFKSFINYSYDTVINGSVQGVNKNINYHMNRVTEVLETIKALVENMLGGNVSSNDNPSESKPSGFGSGSRRRRSSIQLDDSDLEDGTDDFMEIPDSVDEDEMDFNMSDDDDDEEVKTTKKTTKKSTKKTSSKKSAKKSSSKKIKVEDLEDDMGIDDMEDLD